MEALQERKNLSLGHIDVTTHSADEGPCLQSAGCKNVAPVLNRVGDKWSMMIVMMLSNGPMRFSELKRAIDGISQRMLTLSLRGLERDGLVSRHVFAEVPPRVEYQLTPLGHTLHAPLRALGNWAEQHIEEVLTAREAFDKRR